MWAPVVPLLEPGERDVLDARARLVSATKVQGRPRTSREQRDGRLLMTDRRVFYVGTHGVMALTFDEADEIRVEPGPAWSAFVTVDVASGASATFQTGLRSADTLRGLFVAHVRDRA